MKFSLKSLVCGIIALNAYAFAQECGEVKEESIEEDCYNEEAYRAEWRRPRQYVFKFVPYYPEGEALRGEREESRWPGKRNFELFDRLTQ
ncbi:hypothetical protein PHSC3_000497 [Chlamydiales bacterium STE3]|nr:hypothetical protein PHSC3_000497 [Chlamydiales bacterium STE3]